MAIQNISVPTGEGANFFLTLATHILEAKGAEIGDAITAKNFFIKWMESNSETVVDGGLDFAEPVLIAENENFEFRAKTAQIDANIQDMTREFKWDPVLLSGTLVLNECHRLQNQGKAAVKKLLTTMKMQAETTIKNKLNAAIWAASPTANLEPESIPSIVSTTNTTGTIGGISRVGNTFAQNKLYSTTVSSIGSAAGMSVLHQFRRKLGGDAADNPDFAITTTTIFGLIEGWLDSLKQGKVNEKMAQLGFDTIMIGGMTLGYDGDGATGECPSSRIYLLNSKHIFYKVVSGMNKRFEPFSSKDNSWNFTSLFGHFYNITTNLPSSLGVMSAVTG